MPVPNNPVRVFSSMGMGMIANNSAGTIATILKKIFSEKFDQKPVISFNITDEKGYLTINANTHTVGGVVIISGANESPLNDKFFILEKPDANILILDCKGMSNMVGTGTMQSEVMGLDWNMPYTNGTTGFVVRPKDLRYSGGFFQFDDNTTKPAFMQCAYFNTMTAWNVGTDKDAYQWVRRGTGVSVWTKVPQGTWYIIGDNMTMYFIFMNGNTNNTPSNSFYSIGKLNSVFGKSTYSTYYSGTDPSINAISTSWSSTEVSLFTHTAQAWRTPTTSYNTKISVSPYTGIKSQIMSCPLWNGAANSCSLFISDSYLGQVSRIVPVWPTESPYVEFGRLYAFESGKHVGFYRGVRKSDGAFTNVYWESQPLVSTMDTKNGRLILFKTHNLYTSTEANSYHMSPFVAFTSWDTEDDY